MGVPMTLGQGIQPDDAQDRCRLASIYDSPHIIRGRDS